MGSPRIVAADCDDAWLSDIRWVMQRPPRGQTGKRTVQALVAIPSRLPKRSLASDTALRSPLVRAWAASNYRAQFALAEILFASFQLWQATTPPVLTWQDSKNYEAIGSLSLWSSRFWFGSRPPLTPLLWEFTGTPRGFLIGQTLVSVGAWGFLAWTIGNVFPLGWRRLVGSLAILAFATTMPIALWDRSVLSESLALSGLALLFATAIRLAQRPSIGRAGALVASAFWCTLARDTDVVLPAVLGLLLLVFGALYRKNGHLRLILVTAMSLLLAAGFCLATVLESGRDALNATDNMYVRVFPYPSTVAWFASHGMPQANSIDKLARTQAPAPSGTAKTVFPDLKGPTFARLRTWINHHGATTYALWLFLHPWNAVVGPLQKPERTFNNAHGNIEAYAAQNRVTSGLTPVLWPPWIWLVAEIVVALAIALERNVQMNRVVQVCVVLGLLGVVEMLVAWNGDGQEVTRHTIEGLAEFRLGVLITLLHAVLVRTPRHPKPNDEVVGTSLIAG